MAEGIFCNVSLHNHSPSGYYNPNLPIIVLPLAHHRSSEEEVLHFNVLQPHSISDKVCHFICFVVTFDAIFMFLNPSFYQIIYI